MKDRYRDDGWSGAWVDGWMNRWVGFQVYFIFIISVLKHRQ